MKKLGIVLLSLLFIFIVCISYMDNNNKKYNNKLVSNVKNKTEIEKIAYVNKYSDYYIVRNNNYIYVLDKEYKELLKIDVKIVHENKNNYDIIYKDGIVMYYNDYYKDKSLVCNYYDIYKYKLIKSVTLGG